MRAHRSPCSAPTARIPWFRGAPPRPLGPHRGGDGAGRGGRARGAPSAAYDWLRRPPERRRLLVRCLRRRRRSRTHRPRPETNFAPTSPSASGTTTWPPATSAFLRPDVAGRRAARRVRARPAAARRADRLEARGRTARRHRRRAADRLLLASTRRCAARSRSPSSAGSRSRTGSWRPAALRARDPPPPRAVPRQVTATRWTGTTRCSAARCAAPRREAPHRRRAGTASSCPASACAASTPTRG